MFPFLISRRKIEELIKEYINNNNNIIEKQYNIYNNRIVKIEEKVYSFKESIIEDIQKDIEVYMNDVVKTIFKEINDRFDELAKKQQYNNRPVDETRIVREIQSLLDKQIKQDINDYIKQMDLYRKNQIVSDDNQNSPNYSKQINQITLQQTSKFNGLTKEIATLEEKVLKQSNEIESLKKLVLEQSNDIEALKKLVSKQHLIIEQLENNKEVQAETLNLQKETIHTYKEENQKSIIQDFKEKKHDLISETTSLKKPSILFNEEEENNKYVLNKFISQTKQLRTTIEQNFKNNKDIEIYLKLIDKGLIKFELLAGKLEKRQYEPDKLANEVAKILKQTVIKALSQTELKSDIIQYLLECGVRKLDWEIGRKMLDEDYEYMDEVIIYDKVENLLLNNTLTAIKQETFVIDYLEDDNPQEVIIPGLYHIGKYQSIKEQV